MEQKYATVTPRLVVAKFHYTDTDTGPTRARHGQSPRTLSGTSEIPLHGPDTDTDTDFFAAKLRWLRAGPFGSVSVSV